MYVYAGKADALKTFKKILKILLWILVGILGLLLLVSILLYIPPIQKFVVGKAETIVENSTGMKLSVGRFRLKFPLRVEVDDTILITPAGDTLVGFGRLQADVALWPLLAGRVQSPRISLEKARTTYRDTVSAMLLDARLALLKVNGAGLKLKSNAVSLSKVTVSGVDASMELGESRKLDTARVDTASAAWSFALRKVNLDDIKFRMRTSPNVTELTVDLPRGTIGKTSVDLGRQDVDVARIRLQNGFYSYLTGPVVSVRPEVPEETDAVADTLPWRVSVGSVQLVDNAARYGALGAVPADGFDPQNIRADSIQLLVEDILYRGSDISAGLRHLRLHERSGLRITKGWGDFSMDERGISLDGLELSTANSDIKADARVGGGIVDMDASTPLTATLSASVGTGDLFLLVPLDASVKGALRGKRLTVGGDFSGTLGDISIERLAAEMPGHLQFNARGDVRSVISPDNLAGRVTFDGTLRDLGFLKGMIADTALQRRLAFPDRMALTGSASFTSSVYDLERFRLTAGEGAVDASARFDTRAESYRADIDIKDFPLYEFLPHDSLGLATLTLTADGRGFDPVGDMAAEVALAVGRLDYNGYDFGPLNLGASIDEGKVAGNIESGSEALVFGLGLEGALSPDTYTARLAGKVGKADIYGMHLSPDALAVTTIMDISALVSPDTTNTAFSLRATLDSTIVHFGNETQRVALTRIVANSGLRQTSANIRSGDLYVDFSSPMSIDSLTAGFSNAARVITEQFRARSLHMDGIQRSLPDLKLTAQAGRGNALREIALTNGIDFRSISVGVSTSDGEPLRAGVEVDGFHSGTLTLDTINVWARTRGDRLDYSLRLANRPGNIESLALIYLYGDVEQNRAALNLYQRNRADSVGFQFGFEARLLDSMVRATMVPASPTLGYQQWSVNDSNYVSYGFDKRLSADLRLKGPDKHISLTSCGLDCMEEGALRLDMAGIDISNILDLLPTAPPVGGIVSSDIHFGLYEGTVATKGTLGVDNLMYDGRRVADIGAYLDFQSQQSGLMALDSRIDVNKATALTAKGTYITEGEGEMDFTVSIPALPLAIANAFLPEGTATLEGDLDAAVTLKGAPSSLDINGDVGFTGGKATVDMIGTTFGISEERITVTNDRIDFNGFGITAPNNQKLEIDGTLDISDFSNPKADLSVAADDFRAIDSDHRGGSQIYGKAMLDVDVTARGPLDALTVRGDVGLLGTTDVTYILRDQVKQVSDRRQDIVEFMVFADTLFMETYAPVENLRRQSRMDILVGIDIGDGLTAKVFLDELGENRVEVEGGGQLSFSISSQGDMRLSGRYTLSGGTVIYKPPVISQKIFAVQDGSYVEWVGEPANPSFNVKATQSMTVDVTTGSNTRDVKFDITISIQGSLEGIQVTFDVAAPNDSEIQSQLMAMAPEQRMQQALSLLLYNQYTGPGASTQASTASAREQLNSFISKEVNQWARNNLKGVDFSMGIDTKEDAAGSEHTDYSYSVSKSLFSDRVKVSIGGSVSSDATAQSFSDNLVDDITLEYRLTKSDNMFLKVYHYNTQETIFEGEVTETGVGFVMRKRMNRLGDLFRLSDHGAKRDARRKKRQERRELRDEEKAAGMDVAVPPGEAPAAGETSDPAKSQRQEGETRQ